MREDDITAHIADSFENGDFAVEELTEQKYPDGSTVLINGFEWTVLSMSRDSEGLLPFQTDRGEDYNLYRLARRNLQTILRWQFEIDAENK